MSQSVDESLPQVIPVLDLSRGKAVRAVRGLRREYRPLESVLASGSEPFEIACALVERYGFVELYVADLDAIQEGRPQFDLIRRLVDLPARLLLDLGIRSAADLDRARSRLDSERTCYVLATETLASVEELRRTIAASGSARQLALGLDFLRGDLNARGGEDAQSVEPWIEAVRSEAVDSVVALDLDRVGSDQGFAWPGELIASRAFASFSRRISGGGIRSIDDLRSAREAGCDSVLVGSALHDGRISPTALGPTA